MTICGGDAVPPQRKDHHHDVLGDAQDVGVMPPGHTPGGDVGQRRPGFPPASSREAGFLEIEHSVTVSCCTNVVPAKARNLPSALGLKILQVLR